MDYYFEGEHGITQMSDQRKKCRNDQSELALKTHSRLIPLITRQQTLHRRVIVGQTRVSLITLIMGLLLLCTRAWVADYSEDSEDNAHRDHCWCFCCIHVVSD